MIGFGTPSGNSVVQGDTYVDGDPNARNRGYIVHCQVQMRTSIGLVTYQTPESSSWQPENRKPHPNSYKNTYDQFLRNFYIEF